MVQEDVPELLERAEDRVEDELEGDELAGREGLAEDEPEQDEEDRLPEDVDDRPLQEREAPHLPHLRHLEVEDPLRVAGEAPDLRAGQPEALHELEVAQRLGDGSRHPPRLAHDLSLNRLDLPAQEAREGAEQEDPDPERRNQEPGPGDAVPDEEADPDEGGVEDRHRGVHEPLGVGPHLREQRHRLAAAPVLHLLEREPERPAQAVVEHLHPDRLHQEPKCVFLQGRREAGGEGHGRGDEEPAERTSNQLGLGTATGIQGVLVDDPAEDERVDERQDLRDPGEEKRERHETPVRAQVAPQDSHRALFALRRRRRIARHLRATYHPTPDGPSPAAGPGAASSVRSPAVVECRGLRPLAPKGPPHGTRGGGHDSFGSQSPEGRLRKRDGLPVGKEIRR